MQNPLADTQKEQLLERAKICARDCFEKFDEWGFEACVQGAVDDTADERYEVCGYDGPRDVVYAFLDDNRDKIGWELWITNPPQ